MGLIWDPKANTFEENSRVAFLRGIEWGNWPLFMSQVFAPPFLLVFPWLDVILTTVALNVLWSYIRYRFIWFTAANIGMYLVMLKWIVCPATAYYLYIHGFQTAAVLALTWPLLILVIPGVPVQAGVTQAMIMRKFGYDSYGAAEVGE